MSLDEAFRRIESRTNLEKRPPGSNPNRAYRLDRMKALAGLFDDPQGKYRIVHVAGSKGKGSTAAFIAAALAATGLRVGVYASPHLVDYRERFRLQGEAFPEDLLFSIARDIEDRVSGLQDLPGEGDPTTFEILTLMALVLFHKTRRDVAVLETGLGGRLDATNIVHPEAAVITPIEREHTEILGTTIREIAEEKAGIIKAGVKVWSARQPLGARRVLRSRSRLLETPFHALPEMLGGIDPLPPPTGGVPGTRWRLRWRDGRREFLTTAMPGRVQAENAALALMTARDITGDRGDGMVRALADVSLPGRVQLLRRNPPVMIDGAHTPKSVARLLDAFLPLAPRGPVLLFGSVLGKEYEAMARLLAPHFADVIVSTPGFFKESDPLAVARAFKQVHRRVSLEPDPAVAWSAALDIAGAERALLVTGSFFMAAEAAKRGIEPTPDA